MILKKLEYYREGGSEKHIRDITSVVKVQGNRIDRPYIEAWAAQLGLTEIWRRSCIESRSRDREGCFVSLVRVSADCRLSVSARNLSTFITVSVRDLLRERN